MEAPQKRCRTSVVWEHFHLETPNKVRCVYCDRYLAYCNNTSSMMRHLRSTHPAILLGAEDGIPSVPRPATDTVGPSMQCMHCLKNNYNWNIITTFWDTVYKVHSPMPYNLMSQSQLPIMLKIASMWINYNIILCEYTFYRSTYEYPIYCQWQHHFGFPICCSSTFHNIFLCTPSIKMHNITLFRKVSK